MKIESKVIITIIFISALLGVTYNYFSSSGIPLIAEEKKLKQANDIWFDSISPDSIELKDINRETKTGINISEDEEKKSSHLESNQDKEKMNVQSEQKNDLTAKEEIVQTEPLSVSLEQAYKLYKKNVLFIDAREPEDYKIAHIKNAVNIPMDHFEDYEYMLDKIDKNQPVVTYCAGSDCDLSIVLGNVLFDRGYKKLYVFFGGWNEWLKAKYPTEKSEGK